MKRSHPDNPTMDKDSVEDSNSPVVDEDKETNSIPCWKCQGHGRKLNSQTKEYSGPTCPVCQGSGVRQASNKSKWLSQQPGRLVPLRRTTLCGVPAVYGKEFQEDPVELPPSLNPQKGEIVAPLGCGNWRIYQLAAGHKLTVDDFLCAWVTCKELQSRSPDFATMGSQQSNDSRWNHVDLGCGCGSVLMTMAWAFPNTLNCHGVEAQQVSYNLCRRGLTYNVGKDGTDDSHPVRLYHGDLRTWQATSCNHKDGNKDHQGKTKFDVVTGTPPYFPMERFVASANHQQKVRCRMPTRGAASEYILAMDRLLSTENPNAVACLVETARAEAEQAILETMATLPNLIVLKRWDIITKTGLPPRFSAWVLGRPKTPDEKTSTHQSTPSFEIKTLTIRNADQTRTLQYVSTLEEMGWVDFENTRDKLKAQQEPAKEGAKQ